MKLTRKNVTKKTNCLTYYGEGSPYTPYTSSYNAGGAVQVNLSDIFPTLSITGVYADFEEAWLAAKTEIKEQYKVVSDNAKKAYTTAKKWFRSLWDYVAG